MKYANKYVLDFVSLICRSSDTCHLITVLSQQLRRDGRSSVIIFKELKDPLFLDCLTYSNGLNVWLYLSDYWCLCSILLHLQSRNFMDQSERSNSRVLEHAHRAMADHQHAQPICSSILASNPNAETQSHACTAARKISFKASLTSSAMITAPRIDPLKVLRLKLWQFKATGSHNIFRLFQNKVSVLVPLHVYAAEQTRMQHISFGTAEEDNVALWLV